MRTIQGETIVEAVKSMCIEANRHLPEDVKRALVQSVRNEDSQGAKEVLEVIVKNAQLASDKEVAMCQDTGMAVVFVEIGQDVTIEGGGLTDLINEGVRQGYDTGLLRKSVVQDPILRNNTGDNTPAVIHYELVEGEGLKITIAPKGFGSENMSRLYMLKPSEGITGIENAVLETISQAGPNPCPPIVVGVGIGGTFEKAAWMAKKALIRCIDIPNNNLQYAELERTLLKKTNAMGIGPQGFGGKTTALSINIESYPTHIAGLPVAVNIGCHASRHVSKEI